MKTVKSPIISLLSIFALTMMAVGPGIRAADTSTVTATVTVQNYSVSVSDGTVTYGTIATSSTQSTASGGLNDSQTATNDGNVTAKLNIQGSDSGAWTLGGTAGSETYTHKFCITDCDTSPTWTALTTSYQTLNASVVSTGTQVFDLQLGSPTSTATYTEQSVNVTVQATTL